METSLRIYSFSSFALSTSDECCLGRTSKQPRKSSGWPISIKMSFWLLLSTFIRISNTLYFPLSYPPFHVSIYLLASRLNVVSRVTLTMENTAAVLENANFFQLDRLKALCTLTFSSYAACLTCLRWGLLERENYRWNCSPDAHHGRFHLFDLAFIFSISSAYPSPCYHLSIRALQCRPAISIYAAIHLLARRRGSSDRILQGSTVSLFFPLSRLSPHELLWVLTAEPWSECRLESPCRSCEVCQNIFHEWRISAVCCIYCRHCVFEKRDATRSEGNGPK